MAINFEQLEQDLGMAVGTLTEANSKEETVVIDLSSKKIFSVEDYNTLENNHAEELRNKQESSNKIGREEQLKETTNYLKDKYNFEYEGTRTKSENLHKGLDTIFGKSKEPDEQLSEALKQIEAYKEKFNEKDKNHELETSSLKDQIINYESEKVNSKINSKIQSFFDTVKDKVNISRDDFVDLYKARYSVKDVEGVFKPHKNGEVVKNDLRNEVELDEHLGEFSKGYYKKPEGGRGSGEGELGSSPRSPEQFQKQYMKANPNANGADVARAVNQAVKDGSVVVS